MKRFVRTNDNKIYDTSNYNKQNDDSVDGQLYAFYGFIVAESDNITDLIMVGDLVEYNDYIYDFSMTNLLRVILTCDLVNDDILVMKPYCCDENELQKIYTKQGDNYILVWDKERGVI